MDELGALVPGTVPAAATAPVAGPLSGTRVVVKDVIDVAGTVTGAGNPDWAARHAPAGENAEAVASLVDAGAELVAKGQCAELAYSLSGDNAHYGMPTNAAAPDHDPGGSTSGPAAATAGDLCDLGLGTDTLGSIRIPACYCGLFGYRPTHGAISTAGVLPLAQRFDTVGLLARDPDVLRRAGEVLLAPGLAGGDPPRRLLLASDALAAASSEVADAVDRAAERLARSLEASLERIEVLGAGGPGLTAAMDAFSALQGAQVWHNFGAWIEAEQPSLGPDVAARMEGAARVSRRDVMDAEGPAGEVALRIGRLAPTEALVLPTSGTPAPLRGAGPDARQEARLGAGRLSCVASLAGAPAVSLPLGRVGGLPVGTSLVGVPGADRALLAATVRSRQ